MKILLIAFSKVKYAPYIDFYLHTLDSNGCQVHLLYWNRDGEKENLSHLKGITLHEFRTMQEDDVAKYRKIRNFLRFRRFAKNLLRTEHFDALIVLTSLPAVLLSALLTRRYAGRYIFDYRDVTYEHLPFYRRRIHQVARRAAGIFISSEGFRDYLTPDTAHKTYLTHNLRPEDLRHWERENSPSKVIRLAFWGCLRDEPLNRRLVDVLSSDSRFELHYYGREQRTSRSLQEYARKCGAKNVFFHGEYDPKDRHAFARETDLLHNMFSNDTMQPAVSNRYYDGTLFHIPQLCFSGSRMGELCEAAGIGIAADPFGADFSDRIYRWYTHLDRGAFERACEQEIARATPEYQAAQKAVRQLIAACGKQKVCFLLGGFQNCGGIEQVVTTLADGLCERGRWDVHAISFLEEANREPFFPLSPDVKRHRLFDAPCSMRKALVQGHAIRKVRHILRQEGIDTLIACGTLYFPLGCIATCGLPTRCLCWEHTDPMATDDHLFQRACRTFGIRFGDRVIVLTDRAKNTYIETLHAKADKVIRIYNPVPAPVPEKPYQPDATRIISVGRLSGVKDYSLLVEVAAEVLKTHPDWTWDIYGEGEERPLLEDQLRRLSLTGRVRLMGAVRDLQDRYPCYSLLVQTSRCEGFGLVLAEAAAAGLPCVAFDVPSGPGEIIVHGENGLLVPAGDRAAMAQAVTTLIENAALRQKMSVQARQTTRRFSPAPIFRQWETLLDAA